MLNKTAALEKRYVLYQVSRNLWLIGAIWLLYYRLFMTDQQVGVLDAISFGIGLLAEIPAGALADRFGRKKLVCIGIAISSAGVVLQGLAHSYEIILLGQAMTSAGWALCSGADTSLFYESLEYDEDSSQWKKLVLRGGQAAIIATLICYAIGAYLFKISPHLTVIIDGALSFSAILVILGVVEKPRIKTQKQSFTSYISDIIDGAKELTHTRAIMYLPLILTFQGLFYTFGYGLLRPVLQTRFGFQAAGGAWLIVGCGIVTYFLQRRQHRRVDIDTERQGITTIALFTSIALIAGSFNIGFAGGLVIGVIYASEYLFEPWLSDGINKHISNRHRATALSAAAFFKALPYVIVAPLIGYLNVRGKLHYFLIGMACISFIALLIYRAAALAEKSD